MTESEERYTFDPTCPKCRSGEHDPPAKQERARLRQSSWPSREAYERDCERRDKFLAEQEHCPACGSGKDAPGYVEAKDGGALTCSDPFHAEQEGERRLVEVGHYGPLIVNRWTPPLGLGPAERGRPRRFTFHFVPLDWGWWPLRRYERMPSESEQVEVGPDYTPQSTAEWAEPITGPIDPPAEQEGERWTIEICAECKRMNASPAEPHKHGCLTGISRTVEVVPASALAASEAREQYEEERADRLDERLRQALAREEKTEQARAAYEKERDWLEGKLNEALARVRELEGEIRNLVRSAQEPGPKVDPAALDALAVRVGSGPAIDYKAERDAALARVRELEADNASLRLARDGAEHNRKTDNEYPIGERDAALATLRELVRVAEYDEWDTRGTIFAEPLANARALLDGDPDAK